MDVMRLRTLIQTSPLYQKKYAEYIGYRKIELKLIEVNELLDRRANAIETEKINDLA
jgi:hypothetical protein